MASDKRDCGIWGRPSRYSTRRDRRLRLVVGQLEDRVLLANDLQIRVGVGADQIHVRDVTLDPSGNTIVTGTFTGTCDFDPGPGVNALSSIVGSTDTFVAKYRTNGSLAWAGRIGGNLTDEPSGLAVDTVGNIYVAGTYAGFADLDPATSTSFSTSSANSLDVFLVKLNPNGVTAWARSIGGPELDRGGPLAYGTKGGLFLTGSFTDSINLGSATGPNQSAGSEDVFIAKIDVATGSISKSTILGGRGLDEVQGLRVSPLGRVIVAGSFAGSANLGDGSQAVSINSTAGTRDAFAASLSTDLVPFWFKGFGGFGDDSGAGVGVDASDSVYLAGTFNGTADFDPGAAVYNLPLATSPATSVDRAFVARLDVNGKFGWARSLGDTSPLHASSVAVDGSGQVYLSGSFRGVADFGLGVGGFVRTSNGESDGFVLTLTSNGSSRDIQVLGGPNDDDATAVSSRQIGHYVVAGDFVGSISVGGQPFTAAGNQGFYVNLMRPPAVIGDYDGDGRTDLSLYQPTEGMFYRKFSDSSSTSADPFGPQLSGVITSNAALIPVSGDYDGDGRTDLALFDPWSSTFMIRPSGGGTDIIAQFGQGRAGGKDPIPLNADYDGDGKTDLAVFQPWNSSFWYRPSSTGTNDVGIQFGPAPGADSAPIPLVADYDGDGKTDLAVFNAITSVFYYRLSTVGVTANPDPRIQFGRGRSDRLMFHHRWPAYFRGGSPGSRRSPT